MRLFLPLLVLFSLGAVARQPPNIIYIMSDDHDADAISAYNKRLVSTPHIDRLAKEGMLFRNNFVSNSICGPVRAVLLTGQFSHKNGVRDNRTRFDSSRLNLPKVFQQNGYQTALVGKWHLHSYPTGFDYWKILPGQGLYFQPRLISMQGDTSTYPGYATDVVTDEALQWLDKRDKNKPFALHIHHKAPHRNFLPPLKYLEVFSQKTFPEPSTLYTDTTGKGSAWQIQTMSILRDLHLCSDLKVDPKFLEDLPEYKPAASEVNYYHATMNRIPEPERSRIKRLYEQRGLLLREKRPAGKELLRYKYQWYMQDYLACVASVDENVGRVLDYLDKNNLTQHTLVMYTGDQGMYLGENGWFDKRWIYDVSMQAPLLVRWPGKIKAGTVTSQLTQDIDYAPTLLGAAGIPTPEWMQGISLVPLLTKKVKSLERKQLYYHYYESYADHTVPAHLGLRGERYKLAYFYTLGYWELYDLKTDPHEQKNLAGSARHETIFRQLKQDLLRLRNQYDDHSPAGELN